MKKNENKKIAPQMRFNHEKIFVKPIIQLFSLNLRGFFYIQKIDRDQKNIKRYFRQYEVTPKSLKIINIRLTTNAYIIK